jgi:hypothetical protein
MDFEPAQLLWIAAAALLALAVVAAFAEYRRQRRRDIDRPGFVPWNTVQILAFMLAVIAAALALKAG